MTLFTSHLKPKLPPLFSHNLLSNSQAEEEEAIESMAAKDRHRRLSDKSFSLLQSNEFFVNKILSRNSSFGRSARLSSCGLPGQIPFQWEAQPGKPKYQTPEKLPPICIPPPAASGEDLPKASHIVPKQQQEPVRVWFWKKPKGKGRKVAKKNCAFGSSSSSRRRDDESEFCRKSNDESLSCISYSLSSSSSSSSSNGYDRRRSKIGRLAKGFIRWAF